MIEVLIMGGIDILLLIAYGISFICALLLIAALFLYFRKRFRARVVSLFMLAAFFFLGAYTVKMAVAFWIRFSDVTAGDSVFAALKSQAWATAQVGTTLGLVILTVLMYTKRQDLFLSFPAVKREGDIEENDQR
ncbi:hypothetical protein [Paenibacillus tianjinensis]|uniref:Uncharacterized protein n=1 Tax=Paenibacillus tianjinensis TaxID=2810347 RepID=A0ABX7L8A5_9BACL|nr:hypothetical protein [Paenibacillus tianjinensis]QSF42640.1 hypothetical protein JRJ22_15085 [Paenibacillus tianjinensis]